MCPQQVEKETSQELRMLSGHSLTVNNLIIQFVRNSQLCHISQYMSLSLSLFNQTLDLSNYLQFWAKILHTKSA